MYFLFSQYMHERNILHRDLKTQNIFLTKSKIIKVGDLGIARVLEGSNDMATTLIGTPYYMSPELFSNRPYNHKVSISILKEKYVIKPRKLKRLIQTDWVIVPMAFLDALPTLCNRNPGNISEQVTIHCWKRRHVLDLCDLTSYRTCFRKKSESAITLLYPFLFSWIKHKI